MPVLSEKPDSCGRCPKFSAVVEPHRSEWEGSCSAFGVHRNRDSEPCSDGWKK